MDVLKQIFTSGTFINTAINALVVLTGAVVAIVSFTFLIPLDSVQAATGVTVIMGVSYGLSILAWATVMYYFTKPENEKNLVWLLTHLVFLVMFPATIAATAMNMTAIQNTRNLLAGKISA